MQYYGLSSSGGLWAAQLPIAALFKPLKIEKIYYHTVM
jgi:hypothetical protein